MRRTLLVVALLSLAVAGCASQAEHTWIHPGTGQVPAPGMPAER